MKILRLLPFLLVGFACSFSFGQGIEFHSSNLPIVVIDTEGRVIVDEPKVMAKIGIIDNQGQVNNLADPFNGYAGLIGIEFRGSSSQDLFPKKSFGFETWDETEEEVDTTLLGFPKEQDWILHGPFSDKTMMRNKLTFDLYAHTGRYGSRTQYVELVLNGQYHGIYVLMEKIKRDNNRVDIANLREEDNSGDELTGGYILKIDKSTGSGGDGFASEYSPPNASGNQQVFFQYDEPADDKITAPQKGYIESFITRFERTLSSNTYRDPQLGYYQYVDLSSFVDFFLINELSRNVDGYRLSTFLYKDKDSNGGEIHMGPIWDFNLAFGNADYCQGGNTQGWAYQFNDICPGDFWLVPFWWERLLADERFKAAAKLRWYTMREGLWSNESVLAMIDGYAETLAEAQVRNYQKWPVMGEYVWPNNYVGESFEDEVNYLKGWVENRLEWLDEQFEQFEGRVTTGIKASEISIVTYPNPFLNEAHFQVNNLREIESVKIFDFNGRLIRTIAGGVNGLKWDGKNEAGAVVPAATYLYQLTGTDGTIFVGKLLKNTP